VEIGLFDKLGKPICVGNVVHWTDGGDNFDLETRAKTRWDRIAVVSKKGILPQFTVIDSPSQKTKEAAHTFNYGNFIYQDTENYLTVVADSEADYWKMFKSPVDCRKGVIMKTSREAFEQEAQNQGFDISPTKSTIFADSFASLETEKAHGIWQAACEWRDAHWYKKLQSALENGIEGTFGTEYEVANDSAEAGFWIQYDDYVRLKAAISKEMGV